MKNKRKVKKNSDAIMVECLNKLLTMLETTLFQHFFDLNPSIFQNMNNNNNNNKKYYFASDGMNDVLA